MKALQRRCKAHIGRRNYELAQTDIDTMYQYSKGYNADADMLQTKLRKVRMVDRDTDKAFGKNMNLQIKNEKTIKLKT